ncbi:MAG TPA: NAD(P)-dependent oxidoreductase [Pyrinomonadaceae bacterium]|nr:NAD(P)-dependent oxidoreductase [Pyrinomonadaceae bacterium]
MEETRPPLMEVTQALVRSAKANGFGFGKETAIVAAQHMIWQTVDLFRTIADLGVSPENIFVVGKIYSNAPQVIDALSRIGISVTDTTTPTPGEFNRYFQRDIARLWETAERHLSRRKISRIIVLDDGGECITNTPPHLLQRYRMAGVEQTSMGMVVFEKRPPPYAVMSWARSAVKLFIEGPIFAHGLVSKVQTEFLKQGVLRDKEVGIIGLGSIGTATAKLTLLQRNKVFFYDLNPKVFISPELRGRITRLGSLEELMTRCEYVFGCCGCNPFQDQWLMKFRPDIKLFSGSSGDQEFGSIIRDLRKHKRFWVDSESWDIRWEGPYGPMFIGYGGYPYNFTAHNGEPIPTRIVQIETGGLLASLIQAGTHLALYEHGYEQHSGIHRVAPEAQRFVYETWLRAMDKHNIDVTEKFAYEPAMLGAVAGNMQWYDANSEPKTTSGYKPLSRIEETMRNLFGGQRTANS